MAKKIDTNKVLQLESSFTTKSVAAEGDSIESLFVEGYASTNDIDRAGDVIPTSVWEKGMQNYLKNPVILAFHNHSMPVGRMVEHNVDGSGLFIKARVSPADDKIFNKVKDGIITGFSVSFRVLDAEYNSQLEVFLIKELELLEISLVSVPANQNTLFSLSKSFANEDEYQSYKLQFVKDGEVAKGLETSVSDANSKSTKEEIEMDPKDLEALLAKTAEATAKSIIEAQAKAAADIEAKRVAEVARQEEITKAAQAAVKVGESGAEKLMKDLEARFLAEQTSTKSLLDGLQAEVKEKAAELLAMQKSKMTFVEGSRDASGISYSEKEKAVMLAKITRKSIQDTNYGAALIEKAGAHVPSATWELEVNTTMENEVRRRLVVSPILKSIQMKTNVMTLPLNPEASTATWITNAQFGTTDSPGAAQTHQLSEITLNAYKVATREYMAYEEEEDSLLVLLPIVRDAMIRRLARSVDIAFLRGAGAGADPVKGLIPYDASSTVTSAIANKATVDNMLALRRDLGAWGLDPSELRYIVSTDIYYDLLDDDNFQTVDKIGDRATLLTGQIGAIANTPVLVSAEFEAKADTKAGALIVAPANFIVGNQRGLRMEMDQLIEKQSNVMVGSLRTGMVQLTTNLGAGVSVFRWTAT